MPDIVKPQTVTSGLVSIIVPTYNRAKYITTTLGSIVAQTYRPIEILVTDDGSTDNTQAVLTDWENSLHHDDTCTIKLFRQPNKGACAARNHGFRESHGEYIQFLDSDDTLHPEKIARQIAILRQKPELDMVYGAAYWMGAEAQAAYLQNRFMTIPESLVCIAEAQPGFFWTPSPVFRRNVVIRTGGWDESKTGMQDVDFGARIFMLLPKYQYAPDAIIYARPFDDGRSHLAEFSKTRPLEFLRTRLEILRMLWDQIPSVLRNNQSVREAITRNTLQVVIRLALIDDTCILHPAIEDAVQSAHGTRFAHRTKLFAKLANRVGIRNAARAYSSLATIYSTLRKFTRKPHVTA